VLNFKFWLSYLKDNFYDKKFSSNKKKYILQCLAATFISYFILTTLSLISSVLVIASIASTAFIVFCAPHAKRAKTRYILGGYAVGLSMGFLCYSMMKFFITHVPFLHIHFDEIFGALAIGLSIFLMVILDVEHAPACSASLALVISDWNYLTIIITFLALFILIGSRFILRKHLIQLI